MVQYCAVKIRSTAIVVQVFLRPVGESRSAVAQSYRSRLVTHVGPLQRFLAAFPTYTQYARRMIWHLKFLLDTLHRRNGSHT